MTPPVAMARMYDCLDVSRLKDPCRKVTLFLNWPVVNSVGRGGHVNDQRLVGNKGNNCSICSSNIQSINAKFNELEAYVLELEQMQIPVSITHCNEIAFVLVLVRKLPVH